MSTNEYLHEANSLQLIEKSANLTVATKDERKKANCLIRKATSDVSKIFRHRQMTIAKDENVRIDLQGEVVCDGQRFFNYQIQLNQPRTHGESTSIGMVLIPCTVKGLYRRLVRRAFVQSILNTKKITLINVQVSKIS